MKTALVTGASRGIGAATAVELSKLGYVVAINCRENESAALEVSKKISSIGGTSAIFKADVSDSAQVETMFWQIKDELGSVELLVNNAGISYIGLLQDMSPSEIRRVISVDLLGAIYCSREAAKQMIPYKRGAIINISSMWGEVGASCESVYSAAKAGLIGFTKALAKELGPSGIRVNCVSPGVILTDMNAELGEDTLQELAEETPLLRNGKPAYIAKAVAFLADQESEFITGQVISVNGGFIV